MLVVCERVVSIGQFLFRLGVDLTQFGWLQLAEKKYK